MQYKEYPKKQKGKGAQKNNLREKETAKTEKAVKSIPLKKNLPHPLPKWPPNGTSNASLYNKAKDIDDDQTGLIATESTKVSSRLKTV